MQISVVLQILHITCFVNLVEQSGESQKSSSGEDFGKKFASCSVEIISRPTWSTSSITSQGSTVRIGGEWSAGKSSWSHSVIRFTDTTRSTNSIITVWDCSSITSSECGISTLTLCTKLAVGGITRSSLGSGHIFTISNVGDTSLSCVLTSSSIWSSSGQVIIQVLTRVILAVSSIPQITRGVGVNTIVKFGISNRSGQLSCACVSS